MLSLTRILLLCFLVGTAHAASTLVVLGDSLSAGYGIAQKNGWTTLLQQRLKEQGYSYEVINESISGETTSGALSRFPEILARTKPHIVIIELGANDGLRGLSIAALRNNLGELVKRSQDADAKVLVVGMKLPPNYGPQYSQAFSDSFAEVAKRYDTALLPFFFAGFESNLDYFQRDALHPTAAAQPLLLDNVWPHLQPLLEEP